MEHYYLDNSDNVYFISDPHFDHVNILEYCSRPFSSVEEMNHVILNNWKSRIKSEDRVFFLGDMAYGRDSRSPRWWLSQLPGKIIYLKGSHDHGIRPTSVGLNAEMVTDYILLNLENKHKLVLVHDRFTLPKEFMHNKDYWIIHGHNHHEAPFIDRTNRQICVCVEVTNYSPVSLNEILESINVA